jgi:hypothetical protein
MKIFIKKNWFKLGILVILFLGVYFLGINVQKNQEKKSLLNDKNEIPINKTSEINETQEKKLLVKKKTETSSVITTQISTFEDFLEYKLIDAQINCIGFAIYNNVLINKYMDTESFKQAFPDSREFYEDKCRSSYMNVVLNQKILIAEPELQPLRILLTSYSDEVKSFSLYALNGGHSTPMIDSSEKKMDDLLTTSREEVVRLKRKYQIY